MPAVMRTFAGWFERHRRRLARAALLLGALYAASDLWPRLPRETEVEFRLGPRHAEVIELRVAYLERGEELAGASFGFPAGAPQTVRHRVKLPAGRLELRCELRARSGDSRTFVKRLETPVAGRVRIELLDTWSTRSVYVPPAARASAVARSGG